MPGPTLTIRRDELSAEILRAAGDDPSAGLVGAVDRYLRQRQPALAALVQVSACPGGVTITATGSRPLDTLRAVEGVLGVEDRLPEVTPTEELPEMEAGQEEFSVVAAERAEPSPRVREILRSKVRYFPLPTCQWFEISEGELALTSEGVVFEPRWQIVADSDADTTGAIRLPLPEIEGWARDFWLNVPCIRIETKRKGYRYGRPARREEPETIFEIEEWLEALRDLLEGRR